MPIVTLPTSFSGANEDSKQLCLTRRTFATGIAVAALLVGCHDAANTAKVDSLPDAPPDPAFLALSQALTGYADLSPITAARISQGFGQFVPDMKAHFPALTALAREHRQPAQLLAAATEAGLAEPALAIVAAWYKGTVGQGLNASPIAYADALMNRPVADALYPPTYQLGGPGWWTAAPPPIGISPPVERTPGKAAAAPKKP